MFPKMKNVTKNNVFNRFLPITKSVNLGLESEPQISDFKILKELGSGTFAKVLLVEHKKTNAHYALKVIDKQKKFNQQEKNNFLREVEIMYKIHHPNIVKLYGHFEDNKNCYLLMEYIDGGELFSYIPEEDSMPKLSNQQIASIIKDIISATYYIHNMNPQIIHRDIKPENILINSNMRAKLTDFGWSAYIQPGDVRNSVCGTPIYMAPEMINRTGHDEKIDIWSIGVLLFELLTGDQAWAGENFETVKYNIMNLRISWPANMNIYAKDLISKILKSNPHERISLKEMISHPFFSQYFANPTNVLIYPNNKNHKIYIMSKDDPFTWDYLDNEGNYEQQQQQLKLNPNLNNSYGEITYENNNDNNNDNNIYETYDNLQNEYDQLQKPEDISASYNYFNGDINQNEEEINNWQLDESNKNNGKEIPIKDENTLIWETPINNSNQTINNSNQYQPYENNYNSLNDQVYLNNQTGIETNNNQFDINYDFNEQNNYINEEDKKMGNEIDEQIYNSNSYLDNNQQFDSGITFEQNNQENFEEYLF